MERGEVEKTTVGVSCLAHLHTYIISYDSSGRNVMMMLMTMMAKTDTDVRDHERGEKDRGERKWEFSFFSGFGSS